LSDSVLHPDLNTTFFRIFQETLTNIIRHAGATHVTVNLRERDERIILEVKDNGRGISEMEISKTDSMGLLGMRERAALLGGSFKIAPGAGGKGTKVTVSIPISYANGQHENHENSFGGRPRRGAPRLEANSRG
jgi:signal transduction histidine kinase